MQTEYSHNCFISCYQFVTEWDVKRNIDSIFIYHLHQFSDRQRPIDKLRRGVQEIKSWIGQALSLGENFVYVELSNFNIQLWNVSRKPSNKQEKPDCRTARSWSARYCNKQDIVKTEASSSMSLPSNILLYETDSKFHRRLAAHRLLSPDKIHINFANYFE